MTTVRRVLTISANEWRMLWKDQAVLMLLIITPAVMMIILSGAITSLIKQALPGAAASGADFAVPGFTIMFGFFLIGFMGNGFFSEYSWHTWNRLMVSPARPGETMVGKSLPYAATGLLQFAVTFTLGWTLLGMHLRGSAAALLALVLVTILLLVALSLFLFAFCSSQQQISALTNLVGVVGGVLGGAFLPVASLPGWVQAVAPITPQYWLVDGMSSVLGRGAGLADVASSIFVPLIAAVVLIVAALWRLRRVGLRRGLG
ncbi:MAG: ABC transporter permease [Pseudonocardiaceae bacterium]